MGLLDMLPGAVVMAPMTKGSNLPYRRLCVELGARVTLSEMAVARRLKQKRKGEFALIRRAPDEPCFGVQLAGTNPDEMAWAAALVEARGAEFVDVNFGCPIDHFTRKGLGAAIGRQPNRIRRIVEAMKRGVSRVPVTAKIRLGWNDDDRNFLDQARAAADGGADVITVHGRTRSARYRTAADWEAIGQVAAAVPVPVVGNGDILFPHDVEAGRRRSGAIAVMAARGVLIKPWLFREMSEGYLDLDGEARVAIYRRYVALALEHWGTDERGRARVREFLRWHVGFWCRYARRRADGTWPEMQEREGSPVLRSAVEQLLARSDDAALDYVTDRLLAQEALDPDAAPPPSAARADTETLVEG
ncbi:MAG: tRNA-dihydrouridine synthase family protein [Vicinamibacterales bacterium]